MSILLLKLLALLLLFKLFMDKSQKVMNDLYTAFQTTTNNIKDYLENEY